MVDVANLPAIKAYRGIHEYREIAITPVLLDMPSKYLYTDEHLGQAASFSTE